MWDVKSIGVPWSIFDTEAGRVDLLSMLPGVESFSELFDRSIVFPLEDFQIRVASLQDLISMKRASDRPKDRLHLMELEALVRIQQETPDPGKES